MPTLHAIAVAAACGQATVSRALAGHPSVAAATRARIHRIARRMGWRPDPALQALARYRWPGGRSARPLTIVHLVDRYTATNRTKMELVRERARALGYRLEQRQAWTKGLRAAGVLMDCFLPSDPPLPWDDLVVVNVGEGGLSGSCHRVGSDWRQAFDLARTHLPAGLRTGWVNYRFDGPGLTRELRAEMLLAQDETGGEPIPILTVTGPRDEAAFRAWLSRHRPQAVVGVHSCIHDWLRRAGSLAWWCHCGIRDGRGPGVDLRIPERLVHALELLHSRLLAGERGRPAQPVHLLVPGVWVP